tara:strand:+ start:583 stop:756 length:174 start_codon:yes stop_codon:yes gene_type:complete
VLLLAIDRGATFIETMLVLFLTFMLTMIVVDSAYRVYDAWGVLQEEGLIKQGQIQDR